MARPTPWRKSLIPPCPICKQGPHVAKHRTCSKERMALPSFEGELAVNIETGEVFCSGCGKSYSFDGWTQFCDCGAVWQGGEIWQGMAAEIGRVGDVTWLKAAGATQGTLEITFFGWWFCLICGVRARDHGRRYFHRLCPACERKEG